MTERKVFQPIDIGCGLQVHAGGGLVEVSHKPYREDRETKLTVAPGLARQVACAMLKAADAAEGKSAGFVS